MNFTEKIRRDILRTMPEERDCRLAMLAAFSDTGGACEFGTGEDRISFANEHADVAEYLLLLVDRLFGVRMTAEAARGNKPTYTYTGDRAGEYADEITDYCAVNLCSDDFLGIERCMRAYLAGAFLGGGSCTLPHGGAKTGYHLEFVFPDGESAEAFCLLLDRLQLIAHFLPRGERYVVYSKNRDTISDFLAVVGAESALGELEEVSAARAVNNNVNRASNCAAGNADKTAIASAQHVIVFAEMKEEGKLIELSEPLRAAAEARLEHPTDSLSELAGRLGISKSCLNHRMRKLFEIYREEKNND